MCCFCCMHCWLSTWRGTNGICDGQTCTFGLWSSLVTTCPPNPTCQVARPPVVRLSLFQKSDIPPPHCNRSDLQPGTDVTWGGSLSMGREERGVGRNGAGWRAGEHWGRVGWRLGWRGRLGPTSSQEALPAFHCSNTTSHFNGWESGGGDLQRQDFQPDTTRGGWQMNQLSHQNQLGWRKSFQHLNIYCYRNPFFSSQMWKIKNVV